VPEAPVDKRLRFLGRVIKVGLSKRSGNQLIRHGIVEYEWFTTLEFTDTSISTYDPAVRESQ
jgi:hypothetical protein